MRSLPARTTSRTAREHGVVSDVLPGPFTDGVVTIRRLEPGDLDADLEAKDDAQIDWLWLPGERDLWEAMSPQQQRAHALRGLLERRDAFGLGPKWCFAVDAPDARYVAYVDCDLANDQIPAGEANISYSSHPAHRGRGYVTRAVRLALAFLRDHTDAPRAHIIVDAENVDSLRVAASIGAVETGRWTTERGRTMIRHRVEL
jgi:RimJ/RimL family protein N-acetyltransferase